MGNSLSTPAVAAKSTGQLSAVGPGKNRRHELPDRFQSLSHNRRRSKEYSVSKSQLFQDFLLICLYHIIATHIYISTVSNSLCNFLSKHSRVSIGSYIRDDNRFSRIRIDNGTPLSISLYDKINLCIQNWPMSCTDHGDIQLLNTIQCFFHIGFKRPDDIIKIIFRRPHVAFLVCHLAHQCLTAIMRTKRVASH